MQQSVFRPASRKVIAVGILGIIGLIAGVLVGLASTTLRGDLATTATPNNAVWNPVERDFDGVTMMLVPVGCFDMGNDGNDLEKPVTKICFDKPFWIDKYEVTQAQFKKFGGVAAKAPSFSGDTQPVENVTWFEARNFCVKRAAHLPTEAEWEYAARGPDNRIYPWGNTFDSSKAIYERSPSQGTASVGSIPAGAAWSGALDMSGNVGEWTNSLYKSYPYKADDGRENSTSKDSQIRRVLRGGSYGNETDKMRTAFRFGDDPNFQSDGYGFRCARSAD